MPDMTALAVAAGRAIETSRTDGLIFDPYARAFVEAAGATFPVIWPDDPLAASPFDQPLLLGSLYIGMRTRFIDDALAAAGSDGQVVILGAGLDTRAFRLELPGPVYELDSADTLAFKAGIVGDRPGRVAVPADLSTPWADVLIDAGFDCTRPTVWVIEGLLPYLASEPQQQVLDTVIELSAPGSTAILERSVPLASGPDMDEKLQEFSDRTGMKLSDLLARADPPDPVRAFVSAGWSLEQTTVLDLCRRYGRVLSLDPAAEIAPDTGQDPARGGFVVAHSAG